MAGILDFIDQNLGTRLGLLFSNPSGAMQQMNQQAGAYNQASMLATQAERNALRGMPVTPEQAAAKQYVDKITEDLAMGFAGQVTPTSKSALDIASKNAEKMLGLPKGNTAMDRAKALGFNLDVPLYRGTTKPETSYVGQNVYTTTDPKSAEFYASNLSTLQNAVNKGMSPNIIPLYGSKEFVQPNAGSSLWSGGTSYQIPAEYLRSRFAAFDPARAKEPDILAAGVPLGLLAGTNVEMPKKEKRK
jgi:hypothetical protein